VHPSWRRSEKGNDVKRLLIVLALLLVPGMALADQISPGVIYKHDSARLATYNPATNTTVLRPSTFGTGGQMLDIAFGSDSVLYGITSGGKFVSINTSTGVATSLTTVFATGAGVPSDIYALGELGPDGSGNVQFLAGQYTPGNLRKWVWDGATLTDTILGALNDVDGEAFANPNNLNFAGDIWVAEDGTVYATVQDGVNGYLVTLDGSAEADLVATLAGNTQWLGLAASTAVGSPKLYVLQQAGQVDELDLASLVFTSNVGTTSGQNFGAAAIPLPAALPLGLLGFGGLVVLGRRMRKRA